jgi:hypothetical protein
MEWPGHVATSLGLTNATHLQSEQGTVDDREMCGERDYLAGSNPVSITKT